MRAFALCFFSSILLTVSGCRSHEPAPGLQVLIPGEYVFQDACFWRSGAQTLLPRTYPQAGAMAIALSGQDIYCGGYEIVPGSPSTFMAVYWKNSTEYKLTDGTKFAKVNAMAVSGTDVYAAGYAFESDPYLQMDISKIRYWKNGTPVIISTNGNPTSGIINGIAVSGSDVHLAGSDLGGASYWKNGVPTPLQFNAVANAITLKGADVYIAGTIYTGVTVGTTSLSKAVYWKNGTLMELTDGSTIAEAKAIAVSGSDVYVAGNEHTADVEPVYTLKYWKNGVPVTLAPPATNSLLTGIAIDQSDVYVSGTLGGTAVYWKNGVMHPLVGGLGAYANGIALMLPK